MRDAAVDVTGWLLGNLWRDGGQRGARRNAWSAMVADNQRARDRAEAAALLDSPHGPRREEIRQEGELRRA